MLIDKGVTVRGSFQVGEDLEIRGILEGKVLVSGRLVIADGGSLTGEATCRGGSVAGRLAGVLQSDEVVTVEQGSDVSGRIVAPALDFGGSGAAPAAGVARGALDARLAGGEDAARPAPGGETRPARDGIQRSRRPPTVTGDRSQVVVSPASILGGRR